MKISKIQKGLVFVTIASGALAVGCELIVDFDRTKIPVEVTEAAVPDAGALGDAGKPTTDADAAVGTEAGPSDAASDADADQ
jgi:hypothetical protein